MVLENLSSSLKESLKKIARSVLIDKKLVEEVVKDIQRALLSADVNVKLVFDLSNNIKKRVLEEKPKNLDAREHLIKIVYEELVDFLGEEKHGIKIDKKPFRIMLVGLFGSGKTTSAGKIARFYSKRGHKVGVLGLDVHRPAAMDQLEQVSKEAGVSCFIERKEKNPLKIYKKYKNDLKKFDIILIDTAGRDALSKDLIEEIEKLNKEIKPEERLLVISADIGQAAQKQAEQFHKSCDITGVVVTKMDGTAKAGGAVSACSATKAPIKLIGVGEKLGDLEEFNPKGFVSRLLGMGDIEALMEKAKEVVDEDKAKDMSKKMLKGEFNFIDLYEQMGSLRKMGPLSKIMDLIPGAGSMEIPKDMLDVQDEKLKKWKFIFDSCTKAELENPDLLDHTRMERISKGSGVPVGDIRELLKQYRQSKKFMKMMKGGKDMDINKMMKKFGGKKFKFK